MTFRRLEPVRATIRFRFEGDLVDACPGDSVAAALLAAGRLVIRRSPVSGAARAPFCLIGNCYDCLVEIDGQGTRQACLVLAADGLSVSRAGPRE